MAERSNGSVYLVVANIAREFIDRGRLEEFAQLVYDNRHIFPARDFASAVAQYDDPSDYAYDELKENPREALQWVEFALDQLGDTVLIYPMQREEVKYADTWKFWTWEDDDMQFRVSVDKPIMFTAVDMVAWNRVLPRFRFQVGVLRKEALDYWEVWKKLQSTSKWDTLHKGDADVLERAWTKAAMTLKCTRDVLVGDLPARLKQAVARIETIEAEHDTCSTEEVVEEPKKATPTPARVEHISSNTEDAIMADIENGMVAEERIPVEVSNDLLPPTPDPFVKEVPSDPPIISVATSIRPPTPPVPSPLGLSSTGFQFIPTPPLVGVPTVLSPVVPQAVVSSGESKKRKADAISVGSAESNGPPLAKRAKTEGVLGGRDVFDALRALLNKDAVHAYLSMSDAPDLERLVMDTLLSTLHVGSETAAEITRLLPQARATMATWQSRIIAFGSRTSHHVTGPRSHRITQEENTLAVFQLYTGQILAVVDLFSAQWPDLADCIFNRGDVSAMGSLTDNMAMKDVLACREALDRLDVLLESAKLRFGVIIRKIGTMLFHTHRLVAIEYKALVNSASVVTNAVRDMEQEFGKI